MSNFSSQPPEQETVRVTDEATDLRTEVGKMPADFPNYADWSVTLPAGHWRALSTALASAKPEGWRPIDSAPKDGTCIDLFVDGERWADCYWGAPEHSCGESGQYCDSEWHGASDGWVWSTMNEFLPRDEPPSHWMPVTAPAEEVKP